MKKKAKLAANLCTLILPSFQVLLLLPLICFFFFFFLQRFLVTHYQCWARSFSKVVNYSY